MSTTTDTLFAPLPIATAPEASRPILERIQKSFGFISTMLILSAKCNRATTTHPASTTHCKARRRTRRAAETS